VQRCAAPIVSLLQVHAFQLDEVVQGRGCVALGSNVEDISAVEVLAFVIAFHVFNKDFNEIEVSVVGRKMKGCKKFICLHICPLL
jgi:hypothetical protein